MLSGDPNGCAEATPLFPASIAEYEWLYQFSSFTSSIGACGFENLHCLHEIYKKISLCSAERHP